MRVLIRYVLYELTKVFLVTLTGLTMLIIVVVVAQEARAQQLGVGPILRLLPYVLPNALRFAVPGTILFAACSVYGRMSASNELVAAKSLGISPMVVIWPGFILAFLISLACVWLNDVSVSWGRQGVRRVIVESVEEIVYGMLRTHRTYSASQFSIHVQGVDGKTLIRPMILISGAGEMAPLTIVAEKAEMRSYPEDGELVVLVTNGTVEFDDETFYSFPDTQQHVIPLEDAARQGIDSIGPSHQSLRDIPEALTENEQEIHQLRRSLATDATLQMLTGNLDELTSDHWDSRLGKLQRRYYWYHRLRTEPYRRWANGFSCLFFVMVGAPLAIRLRNADLMTTFGVCFLPILIVYYPLLVLAVDRAKDGALPPYVVWMGNVILCAAGAWLLRKVIRY